MKNHFSSWVRKPQKNIELGAYGMAVFILQFLTEVEIILLRDRKL